MQESRSTLPVRRLHAVAAQDALRAVDSAAHGLSTAEAAARLARLGPNRLPERRARSALERFLLQFRNVLIYVLLGAACVTALLGHWVDTGVILGVVLVNAIVGFVQEGKAERALDSIRAMLSPTALVLRDGRLATIAARELVPGDVVHVQSGDRVPADLRLLRVKSLRIDESSLTGESVPVEKQAEPVAAAAPLGDRASMAFSGTLVTFGQGRGVVVATGRDTELGRISELLAAVESLETPLLRKMAAFARALSAAILAIAALAFLGGIARGYAAAEMFLAAVGLAVAAIPEGLPAVMTVTLAIGVQRMARRNAIVRRLPAVEALGSVTVVCSDKTGTLTRNEMTAAAVVTAERAYDVSGAGYAPQGRFVAGEAVVDPLAGEAEHATLVELLRAGMLCNDACVHQREGRWSVDGDPTEGALIVAAMKAGLDPFLENERRPRTDVIPFESEHRFMATLHHDHAGHAFVFLKGAPERVLELCTHERQAGEDRPLARALWERRVDALAEQGRRVLAVATRAAAPETRELRFGDVEGGLTLLGLAGMIDPPREEAIRAVAACRAAGIRVKMITGDHRATAAAIAAALGIAPGAAAASGPELERTDDEQLREVAQNVNVYARVSPEHKLRLVEALQARGEVVAMTGDGVNDAPALKRADIGVAMGVTGTEAAKEAAEIVLADDNFASIASAVEEGRTVYDNLRKTILFMMPTNGAEAGTLVAAIALGLALPILPVQILWVNMITAVTLSLALVVEPAEPDVMRRPPRDPGAPIFSRYFVWRTVLVSLVGVAATLGMFLWERAAGATLDAARTAAVNTLVLVEAFYLLNARFLTTPATPRALASGNPYVPAMIATVVGFQLLFTYAPFMQRLFHSTALDAGVWLRAAAAASSVYFVVELEKWLVRRSALPAG
ncbi:MAG: HAD-IC family P-type ATPase [Burkholderiales bacterium]|nr:HAD-IC family P-type ATPase [Burkholderiales bacterium]